MDTQSKKLANLTVDNIQSQQYEQTLNETYRHIIMETLSNHADAPEINSQIQTVAVFDTNRDHYQLLRIGWIDSQQRIFNPILHIDIIEGKVWIQENRTDIDIGEELSDRGIAKSNIVLGLHPPHLRPLNPDYCVI